VVDLIIAAVLAAGFVDIAVDAIIEATTVLYQLHFP